MAMKFVMLTQNLQSFQMQGIFLQIFPVRVKTKTKGGKPQEYDVILLKKVYWSLGYFEM